jgi:pimeloyl-ACP methyl ester carboxylesterase
MALGQNAVPHCCILVFVIFHVLPETGYDTATLVEDIRQFLDALKIQRVILVGHSIAGDELTRFAVLHPDRVIKLVYLDAAYDRTRMPEQAVPPQS